MADLSTSISPLSELKMTTPSPFERTTTASPSHRHHVDLYNFDDPRFENYRYVLTSPRSIEACQRMGVKPVTLLPKSFARFQDEMKNLDLDVRELYDRFLDSEKRRLEMLEMCRGERKKVVDEELTRQQGVNDATTINKNATTILPNKSQVHFSKDRPSGIKLAASFGIGVSENYNTEQQVLGSEADKARRMAESRAEHSSRLSQLKQQLETLETETRMLRMNSATKPPSRSMLYKSLSGAPPPKAEVDNTMDASWVMSEMKKHVEFNEAPPRPSRSATTRATIGQKPVRARSAGTSKYIDNAIVSGVGLLKKPEEASAFHQMVTNHADELHRQVDHQRSLMEQSQMVDEWRHLISERKKAEEAQARARRRRLLLEKKLKSQQERLEKELTQRGNLRRLEEEEHAYREMLRTSIVSKDRRTEEMLRDKDEEIERSRQISRMSERLREEMRRSVNADSFDKKARRVVIENGIGRGPRTSTCNVSKLKLG